jgi:raffinose/stachyose/melibiose transport system permease protein
MKKAVKKFTYTLLAVSLGASLLAGCSSGGKWAWNDFMLPLVILSDREMETLPLVQYMFQSQFSTDYNLAFASYLMALAPMIIVYIFAQKWIINGVTKGAIK